MANRYWVGGTGTWNTISTTNWSTTSGGSNGASVPTSADSVFFDQAGGYTVTMTGVLNCLDITVTTGTVTFATGTSPSLNIYGSMSLASTTWNSTGAISFLSSSTGRTINTGGTTLSTTNLIFNGTGGWTLGANLTILATSTTTFTAGSLDLAGFTLTTGIFSSSNSNTRSIAFGSGFISLIRSGSNDVNLEMSNGTNFTYTGTGGFITDMITTRTFRIGQTGGMTMSNAPNLKVSGSNQITIDSGSWIKKLEFYASSTSTVAPTSLNLQDLYLDSGTYSSLTVNQVSPGNISGNSRSLAALSIQHSGTTTLLSTTNVVNGGAFTFGTTSTPTLNLNGFDMTVGTFNSSSSTARSITFGSNIITTQTGGVNMADATNFTWSGTGGFRGNQGTAEQTYNFGSSAGGSATNAINISFFGGTTSSAATLTENSWFNKIDCTGLTGRVGTGGSSVRSVYVNNLILEGTATSAAYTFLQANMFGITSTISGNGKQLYTFTIPASSTVTLSSALAVTLYTQVTNTTLNLAGFTLTCAIPTGSFTYTGGTLTMSGATIQCITYVHNGPSFTLNNGTLNCSTSFTLTSGSFTLAATGGTLGATPLITHTAGTMTFLKSYALTLGSTYQFTSGILDITDTTLSAGKFNSSNSNTRSIAFGTGFINLTFNSSGEINLEMSDGTNFTYTGTGGFITDMITSRRLRIGQAGGMTMSNAPNLKVSGSNQITIDSGSWIKKLEFYASSTSTVAPTSLNLQDLYLDSGTYTSLTANIVSSGNISGNSRSLAALNIQHSGTTTLLSTTNVINSGTFTFGTTSTPTLNLNGFDMTVGIFQSSSSTVRSITFGSNIITTQTGGVNMADATNFTWSGTGGFRGNQGTGEQTYTFGTTGGSATNAINISFFGGTTSSVATLTENSWFNKIDCTGLTGRVGTGGSFVRSVYVNNLILEGTATSAAYTFLQANMFGTTSTISGNGRQLYTFTIPAASTTTLVSSLAVTLYSQVTNTTLNLAGFTLTCAIPTGSFTYTGGTLTLNGGTIQCITYVHDGPSFTLNNGTINCSTSFTITSGSFTLAATGGTLGATPLITHTAGTMTFLKSYALTVSGTYQFTSGTIDITNVTLSTGKFNSNNSNTRNIIFGTGSISITFTASTGDIVLDMATMTNFTYTGTGGFTCDMGTTRTFRTGSAGGATLDNAPNLSFVGGNQTITLTGNSWFNTLSFPAGTSTVTTDTLYLRNLTLGGGTYISMLPNMQGTGTITGNGKTVSTLTANFVGTLTMSGTLTVTNAFTFGTSANIAMTLSGDIRVGSFSSSGTNTRSIGFGTFYISTTTALSMADITNFTYTGTGGFKTDHTTTRSISVGSSAGGSAANAVNLLVLNQGDVSIVTGSWFKALNFTSVTTNSASISSAGTGTNVLNLTIGALGTYTAFSATMYGTSTIAGSARPLNTFYITSGSTTTFTSAVAVSSYIHEPNTTLNLATFAFTVTSTITVNGGSMINFGTTSCTTFTINGATLTVNSGSLNPTTSFVINSGVYTLGSLGSMGTTFTTFTHNGGNVIFQKSYTMSVTAIYTFIAGSLDVSGITLGVGKFNSDNSNTRTLTFGTGFIRATYSSTGDIVIGMANITNITFVATTGGFLAPASNTKIVTIGTTGGGSSTNAPNVSLESGSSIVTLTSGSWFNKLDFGTTTFTIATTTINANSVTLAGGTYTSMLINLIGTGVLNGNGKTINTLNISHVGTTTFSSTLTCTTLNQNSGTVNFATFNLTCTGTVTVTAGTYNNMGTLTCATFTIVGTFNLSSGTLTATTSFIVNSGAFTYSTGTLTARATFTHNGGTVTFSKAYALTATGTYTLSGGDLILNGVDLTTGIFSSSGAGTRSIQFGTNNIVLAHTTAATTVLAMADVSNLTVTGTGGFTAAANITRTYTYGSTSGASATNSSNLTLTGSGTAIATITTGSWFNTLNFGATAFAIPATTVNINAITLSSGGTFTGLTVQMRGTGLITTSGKTIAGFVLNTIGTNTLAGNVTCTSYTLTAGLINLAGFNIICSGVVTATDGSMLNAGTITCTTFTVNGTFSFDSGTITPSVSVILSSGTFNYNSGGTLSPVPTFTHTGGTFNLGKAYALTATGTYAFTAGTLNLNGFNLTTGIFNSSGTSPRSILFGTNNIILAHTSVGQTVLGMADTTSFSNTGTGGFASAMTVARTFTVGTAVGAFNTSPNLSITSGVAQPTITNNSWFKILDFTGSSTTPTATTVNVDTLILSSGGTYTDLIPQFTRSQTWTAQFGKQLGGIGINALFNTLTLDNTQTYSPTSVCSVVAGTLNLGGTDLTIGSFSSSGTLTRSVIFGSNNIILSTPTAGVTVLSVADATNFSCSFVTGGFVASSALTRTFVFGTTGGTSITAPNLTINSGSAIPTITTGSWFHILDFTGSSCTPAVSTVNVTSAILSSGGTFTNLSLTMRSNGSLTSNNKTISAFIVNHTDFGTTTIIGALLCTTQTYTLGNVDFGNNNATSSAGAAYSSGAFSNINTITCTTFTITGTFLLTQGTITPSVSIILTSGSLTYNGGIISPVPTFTHSAGTFILGKAYALTATGTYTLTIGSIVLNGYNLTTGIFSSSGTGARSITFSTGNIILATTTAATTNLLMNDATNFTQTATTGGFVSDASITRTFIFGTTGGTVTNAPNLAITSGSAVPTISTGSWFNTLDFTGSSTTPIAATLQLSTLILTSGGTYTGLLPVFTRTQTWTAQFSKQLGGIGFNLVGGTLTLDATQTYTATSQCILTAGTINLGGADLTIGTFSSNNSNVRSLVLGSNSITLATTTAAATNIDMATATNFTISGTGGFIAAASTSRTFSFGSTAGGTATNSPNLTFTSGASTQTITTASWFNKLDFGTTSFQATSGSLNLNSLTLSGTGSYINLAVTMVGSGIIISNGNSTLQNLTVNGTGITTTLGSAFTLTGSSTATGNVQLDAGTLVLANFLLTCNRFITTTTSTRAISFGTGNIVLAINIAGAVVIAMSDVTNFTWTGTGTVGFTTVMGVSRQVNFGNTAGGSATNAINLSVTGGASALALTSGGWFNNLNFTGSTSTAAGTINVSTLTLDTGGTYTGLAPTFTRTQTWTPQFSKQLNGIGVNGSGVTLTLTAGQTYTATSQCLLTLGTIDLGGSDLTIGTFSSNNTNVRSLVLGTNNIILSITTAAATNLDMANATNFTITGTGGFTAAADITRTFTFGTTGGSSTNSPNLTFTGSGTAIQTITTGSWFNTLSFGTTVFNPGTISINLNGLTLSATGTFSTMTALMRGTGTIISNGNTTLNTLTINNVSGTTTLGSAFTVTAGIITLTSGGLDLVSFTLTAVVSFNASGTLARSIAFGTGSINLSNAATAAAVLNIADATNFTCSGTGGFTSTAGSTKTFTFGTTGGSSTNSPNLTISGGAAVTLTNGSWFNHLLFTSGFSNTTAVNNTPNLNSLTLGINGGYSSTNFTMVGTGTITPNGKEILDLTINCPSGTTTLAGSFTVRAFTLTQGTFDVNNFIVTVGTNLGNGFISSNTNTRSIAFGTGSILVRGSVGLQMANATNFTWTGTGGFGSDTSTTGRVFTFGSTAGGSASNAPNLTIEGGTLNASFTAGSWFKILNIINTSGTFTGGLIYVDTLSGLTSGNYSALIPVFTRTQTWTMLNSKQLGGIGVNGSGVTLTLDGTQTYTATSVCYLTQGTLNLGGANLTIGSFSSSNSNTRAIEFGTNNIILATTTSGATNLDMGNTFNFTYTGTGGFVAAADITRIFAVGTVGPPVGGDVYSTPGTYSWTAPSGVTSVSAIAIGAGGNGIPNGFNYGWGGGGGGLGWKNNISVTPGQSYTVVVGGTGTGDSYFINTSTVAGFGGVDGGAGGGYLGDGGGNGGAGGSKRGGGGAGGYSGNGGAGGVAPQSGTGQGSAGTGGGAAGGSAFDTLSGNQAGSKGGGGVGIYGEGTSGTSSSQGGSDGTNGGAIYNTGSGATENVWGGTGGDYGGGGGVGVRGNTAGANISQGGIAGTGAVRIIWGPDRSFPSTNLSAAYEAAAEGSSSTITPANAINLSFTGVGTAIQTIVTGSTIKNLNFGTTGFAIQSATIINVDTLTLSSSGTYSNLTPLFTRTQTWTPQFSKQLGGIGVSATGVTLTLEATQTYVASPQLIVDDGTLNLNGITFIASNFLSRGTGTRSITGSGVITVNNSWVVNYGVGFTGSSYTINAFCPTFAGGGGSYGTLIQKNSTLTITGSNTFVDIQTTVANNFLINYLVVAGGGGGRFASGGGGGGGIIYSSSDAAFTNSLYTITVGSGGAGAPYGSLANGSNGENSSIIGQVINSIALGGGGGAYYNVDGNSGGSGGGAGYRFGAGDGLVGGAATQTSGASYTGYGYPGGNTITGQSQPFSGAGGGGAGVVGGSVTSAAGLAGLGGNGIAFDISGTSTYYGGGGAGGAGGSGYATPITTPALGGGGICGGNGGGTAMNGTANTGGGGAADNRPTGNTYTGSPGTGGSGIVIIRYLDTYPAAITTGSPTITVAGGYRVYKWTTSGSIIFQ